MVKDMYTGNAMGKQLYGASSTDTQWTHASKPLYPAGTKADADAEGKEQAQIVDSH